MMAHLLIGIFALSLVIGLPAMPMQMETGSPMTRDRAKMPISKWAWPACFPS